MGIISGGTAAIIGLLGLGAGAAAVGARKQRKAQQKTRESAEQKLEAQKIATQQAQAAPGEAAEKARQASLRRRRGRAKTLLTSAKGVKSPGTVLRETLGGT